MSKNNLRYGGYFNYILSGFQITNDNGWGGGIRVEMSMLGD